MSSQAIKRKLTLLASVLLLGVLAVIGYYQFGPKPLNIRDSIEEGVEIAKNTTSLSPESESLLRVQLAILNFASRTGHPPDTLAELVPTYFDTVPKNPRTQRPFEYEVTADGAFQLGEQTKLAKLAPASQDQASGEQLALEATESVLGDDEDFINPNSMTEEDFVYDPTGKRDPFMPFDLSPKMVNEDAETPLEMYSLGQLRLTAILNDPTGLGDQKMGIVEDAGGKGYTVRVGTKIGNAGGVIIGIEQDHIKVLETSVDFTGAEKQRVIELSIKVESKKRK